ncbi:MAG: insulinase family protein [Syntrophobacterales bacterium]|nr:insulinase family protein [Syntrophobacterales bacterium]
MAALAALQQATLKNGLSLLGVEYPRVPWISLAFMCKRGSETDPPDKPGVADWTAELLTQGTRRRRQLELAQDIEALGAALAARGGWDATYVHLDGLAEDMETLMATLAEVALTPAFPADDFALLKERRRAELTQAMDDPREVANRTFTRLFFQGAPYGHAVRGELARVDAVGLEDLTAWYAREFVPEESVLVCVGMVPFPRLVEAAARHFGSWGGGGPASPAWREAPARLAAPGIYLLDRPELTQSEIRLGHLGLPRSHPDYFPVRLLNYILGEGGFSSRLMGRIRSELGLTYGIRSTFAWRRAPGPFVISTFTPAGNTALAIKEIQRVVQEVQEAGVTAQELAEAQSYYIGHFPLGLETPRALIRQVLNIGLHDLGLDYLARYRERVAAVTLEEVRRAAQAHLHPQRLVTLVVGPAAQVKEPLAEIGPVTEFPTAESGFF